MDLEVPRSVEDEPYPLHHPQARDQPYDRLEGHLGRLLHRIAEGPSRDGREGDRLDLVSLGQLEHPPVALGQELLHRLIDPVDRPETVNDIAIGKVIAPSEDRLPGPERGRPRGGSPRPRRPQGGAGRWPRALPR